MMQKLTVGDGMQGDLRKEGEGRFDKSKISVTLDRPLLCFEDDTSVCASHEELRSLCFPRVVFRRQKKSREKKFDRNWRSARNAFSSPLCCFEGHRLA